MATSVLTRQHGLDHSCDGCVSGVGMELDIKYINPLKKSGLQRHYAIYLYYNTVGSCTRSVGS